MASYTRRDIVGGAAATTLATGIGSGDTTIVVADATNWPTGSNGDFFICLDRGNSGEEKVRCASRTGVTITVQTSGRGADGTSAAAHSAGVSVEHVITALDADEANYAVSETVGKITTTGDLLVSDGANSLTRLPNGTSGLPLVAGASTPAYGALTSTGLGAGSVGATQIAPGVITTTHIASGAAITNGQLATEAQSTVKGRAASAGTGAVTDLTATQVRTIIDTNTTPSTQAVGDSAAVGTADTLARGDHKHAMPAFGTTAGTIAQGNDSRLSDTRTPSSASITSAMFASEASTAWTPTIGGGWTRSNGTVSGTYFKHGRLCFVDWKYTIGSSDTKGTGLTVSNLPFAPVKAYYGRCEATDASDSTVSYPGSMKIAASATSGTVRFSGALAAPGSVINSGVDSNTPLVWATGDIIEGWLIYETAS